MFDWLYRKITKKPKTKQNKNTVLASDFVTYILYISELGTNLIDDKREEENVNVYEIKFQSICRETNRKEIALLLLFFILMLTAYKREEIT